MYQADAKLQIADNVARLFHALDDRDWAALRDICADRLDVEYPARPGVREQMPVETLVDELRSFLPGFTATHHHAGHPVVTLHDTDRGSVKVDVTVTHVIGNEGEDLRSWTIGVRYDFDVAFTGDDWKLTSSRARTIYSQGGNLAHEAVERATAKG